MGHSVFGYDLPLVADCFLGDHFMWCGFGVRDVEGEGRGKWECKSMAYFRSHLSSEEVGLDLGGLVVPVFELGLQV